MIRLPRLQIDRDDLGEINLTQKARVWIEADNAKRGSEVHASDLLDPLLAFWKKVSPKELTDRQVFLFLIGKILHHFVLDIHEPGTEIGQTDSGTREEMGIHFSPDHESAEGYPIELKSNRAQREPHPNKLQEEYHNYLEQLAIYMILSNVMTGFLWILHLNLKDEANRTWPEPRCYKVSMTEEQFYDIEQQIFEARDQLTWAIEHRNPSKLPYCRTWLCGDNCVYFKYECKPNGRFGLPRKQWTS